jgi:hypothetical protein
MLTGIAFFNADLVAACLGDLISTTDIRLYYKFNNNTNDSSGRAVNATATNLDYGTGPYTDFLQAASIRRAADGSATGSQIYLENSSFTQSGAGVGFTVALWVNLRNLPASNTLMTLSAKYQIGTPSGGFDFRFYNNAGTQTVQFLFSNSNNAAGNRDSIATLTQSLATNTWHHMVGVYDGTRCYIYRNGASVSTAAAACTSVLSVTRRHTIGYADIGSAPNNQIRYLDGRIDDYSLFWRALSPSEIATLAAGPCPLNT